MREVWPVTAVRKAESTVMASLPEGTLMQRAAAGLEKVAADLLVKHFGGVYGRSVLLLTGMGDNGGDALFAGARLAGRGAAVRAVQILGSRRHEGGHKALRMAGGRFISPEDVGYHDLVLDGVTGIGGRPGLPIEAVNRLRKVRAGVTVAVDVPSGVNVDTGEAVGQAVHAEHTVTFGCLKPAHVTGPASELCGEIHLVDIGIGRALRHGDSVLSVPEESDIAEWVRRPGPADDKYTRGVAGIAAGSTRYPGAPLLAAAGAQAGPAGMIRFAGDQWRQVVSRHPSIVATPGIEEAGRVQAWLAGPGTGTGPRALKTLEHVLEAEVPTVLDADALTLVAKHSRLLAGRRAPLVLTPHDREYERLYGSPPEGDRASSALALASRLNAVVLLKGHRTIVADPDGSVYANPTGTPDLATAGSGDTLAGLLVSLLASGLGGGRAAAAAAYLHGLAGEFAARDGRPATAEDLGDALRDAVASVRTP
ncbi:NAD(P)H-hydrate dehydratase [Salininema proteolyticum]|uniref:ADP-dependent (S)-NAD(P)H-hydrate dehydratase n=1 Tax=Salininema proteolyticum TaxID=1607685 RepID=A0ABV8TT42_9ACTN